MSFSRCNPLGFALFEVLTSAQMNVLDANMVNAVDGAGGGTYAPTAKIQFDGDIEWAGVRLPKLVSRSYTRVQGLHFIGTGNKAAATVQDCYPFSGCDFKVSADGSYVEQIYADSTIGHDDQPTVYLACPNLIDRATITHAGIYVCPDATGTEPQYRPEVALIRRQASDGSDTELMREEDYSATGSYRGVYHNIEGALSPTEGVVQTLWPYYLYVLRVDGESGLSAVPGLRVLGGYIKFTCTEVTPG